jgi:hypothetical protein
MSLEFQKYLSPAFMKNSGMLSHEKIKKSSMTDAEEAPTLKFGSADSESSDMSPEEREKKVKIFIDTHKETRRRSAVVDYTLSGLSLGGLSGYLLENKENPQSHRSPKPVILGALTGALSGLLLGQLIVPWVAHSEGKAITDGDELGIKSYGYSEFIERDNIGIPGSNLLSTLITGKLLFSPM